MPRQTPYSTYIRRISAIAGVAAIVAGSVLAGINAFSAEKPQWRVVSITHSSSADKWKVVSITKTSSAENYTLTEEQKQIMELYWKPY